MLPVGNHTPGIGPAALTGTVVLMKTITSAKLLTKTKRQRGIVNISFRRSSLRRGFRRRRMKKMVTPEEAFRWVAGPWLLWGDTPR
jgi:hypothetical protein